jgi:hypothetical protein
MAHPWSGLAEMAPCLWVTIPLKNELTPIFLSPMTMDPVGSFDC